MDQAWLYAFPSARRAAGTVRRLEGMAVEGILGVGVFCAGNSPTWYVYVTARDPTPTDAACIVAALNAFGRPTSLRLDELLQSSLHLVLAGPPTLILQGLLALHANAAVH